MPSTTIQPALFLSPKLSGRSRSALRMLASVTIVAAGLLMSSSAMASKRITVKLLNTTPSTPMTCEVHKVSTATGSEVATRLAGFTAKPKDEKPSADANKAQEFIMRVSYVVKRIDGSVVYPKLRLTCNAGGNTQNRSILWDHTSKSFDTYRFYGSCRSGATCITNVERK